MSDRDWHVRAPRPANVRIGPAVWSINYDSRASRRLSAHDGQHCLGRANGNTYEIHVDDFGLPEDGLRCTLFHEVLHAVFHAYQVDSEKTAHDERNEELVYRLEAPLLQVLRDNPLLVNYLTDQPHPR